jgi:CRP-like cAMP-binding protein
METLGPGGIFGEMALIDGTVRSATVRAKTDCEVAPINEKTFLFLVHETPFFAIAVMRALAGRLRHMNEP